MAPAFELLLSITDGSIFFQVSEFTVENPSDVPVIAQIIPLHIYPNPQMMLDATASSSIPDLTSDYIEMEDNEIFSLPDLLELHLANSSFAAMRHTVETTLGVRPHRQTLTVVVPPRDKIIVRVAFQPKDDSSRASLIVIRWGNIIYV